MRASCREAPNKEGGPGCEVAEVLGVDAVQVAQDRVAGVSCKGLNPPDVDAAGGEEDAEEPAAEGPQDGDLSEGDSAEMAVLVTALESTLDHAKVGPIGFWAVAPEAKTVKARPSVHRVNMRRVPRGNVGAASRRGAGRVEIMAGIMAAESTEERRALIKLSI